MSDIQVQESSSTVSKIDNFNSMEEMLQTAEKLIKSNFLPRALNTPEKAVAVILSGRELGFKAMAAIRNVHVIQGQTALSVHAIGALLKSAGIKYELIEDCIKIDADGNPTDDPKAVKDIRTTIRFYEKFGNEVIKNDMSFRYSEAKQQGLDGKDNWQRMLRIMMRNRCLAIGARFVAPDAFLGMYTADEMADFKNVQYEVKEDGSVEITE